MIDKRHAELVSASHQKMDSASGAERQVTNSKIPTIQKSDI
jgi:hypothetical protein